MNASAGPCVRSFLLFAVTFASSLIAESAFATEHVSGQVLGAGAPIAKSTVTLWRASANAPVKLAETKTNDQRQFDIRTTGTRFTDSILYLVANGGEPKAQNATGDNPAIALLLVLGNNPPEKVSRSR